MFYSLRNLKDHSFKHKYLRIDNSTMVVILGNVIPGRTVGMALKVKSIHFERYILRGNRITFQPERVEVARIIVHNSELICERAKENNILGDVRNV